MVNRIRILLAVIFSILVIFTVRLMYLQMVVAEELSSKSEENIRTEQYIQPLRGRILARDGTVLADNRLAWDLMYWGGEIKHWDKLKFLLKLDDFPEAPNRADRVERQLGAVAAFNISDDLVPAIEELVAGQTNLYLRSRIERTYPTNLAAQTVGYTSEAQGRFAGYALSDLVGIMGLEASYQQDLFGTPGRLDVQVDNRGIVINSRTLRPAKPGKSLTLTIDPRTQRLAEDALEGALQYVQVEREKRDLPFEEMVRGAFIVLDPRNGDVLAMASSPSFDQNTFTRRPSDPDAIQALLTDKTNLPMSNRAVEAYPPASTFKLITSSALLENNYVTPSQRYSCSASLNFGGIRWDNWSYPAGRGSYTVVDAIGDSCNTYYWRALLDTPDARLAGWSPFVQALFGRADDFGYGQKVGVGLLEEKPGRIPTESWANSVYEFGWLPGFSLNSAIGQGDVLATPLQVAQLTAAIAMDGVLFQPRLVKKIGDETLKPEFRVIEGQHWSTLQEGMRQMITDYGTNYVLGPAADFPINLSGKTGTAENARGIGYDHVGFTAFAPTDNPEIVIYVFVEHGDKSTQVAVPTARDFFVEYFELDEFAQTLVNQ